MLVSMLLACSDYGVVKRDDVAGVGDDSGGPAVDVDDAIARCYAALEDLSIDPSVDDACRIDPIAGDLATMVLWSRTDFLNYPQYGQVLMMPVVGRLVDSDGDGAVTDADTPVVALVSDDDGTNGPDTHGVLRLLDGASGDEVLAFTRADLGSVQVYAYRYGGLALGDVDADGRGDIVGIAEVVLPPDDGGGGGGGSDTSDGGGGGGGGDTAVEDEPPIRPGPGMCRVAAWRADGTALWVSDVDIACAGHAPALADLEGDGAPEVIVGASVYEGATGAVVFTGVDGDGGPSPYAQAGSISFALDLDGDGVQEVIAGNTIYEATGAVRCTTGGADGFSAAADMDGDGLGDVVTVAEGDVRVTRHDCSLIAEWAVEGGGAGGPPTIGDFDADMRPEVGVAAAAAYTVYEADGTVLWGAPVSDASSHTTGSSVYDFDGDGRSEVVYADETTLYVWDGADGTVRLRDDGHSSRTLHEYPVVADIDGDYAPEILVPNGGGHYGDDETGVYALASLNGTWLGGRPVWNQHAYSIVNIDDDLHVPVTPATSWPTWNTFRSGDVNPTSGADRPDAFPAIGVCLDTCASMGSVVIGVRVGNAGAGALRAGTPVTAYVDDVAVATTTTAWAVAPGAASEVVHLIVPAEYATEVRIVVDDWRGVEAVRECREDNNSAVTTEMCP